MEQVNGLQVYMKQIREIPLLTADQEKELAIKYQAGKARFITGQVYAIDGGRGLSMKGSD